MVSLSCFSVSFLPRDLKRELTSSEEMLPLPSTSIASNAFLSVI